MTIGGILYDLLTPSTNWRSGISPASAIFRRNARVARRTYTEYAPAGMPRASTRNLTLPVGQPWRGRRMTPKPRSAWR